MSDITPNNDMPDNNGNKLPRHLLLLGVAALLILASIIIDLALVIQHSQFTPEKAATEIVGMQFFTLQTCSGFIREAGFALAISWAISMTIERVTRERDTKHAVETRNLIAQDVFRAVIGSFAPPDIRDVTFDTILLAPITRRSLRLDITLQHLPTGHGHLRTKFICVAYAVDYEVFNETSSHRPYNIDLYIEKCPIPELESEQRIDTIAIGTEPALNPVNINEGRSLPDTDGEMRYRWTRSIPPKGNLRVIMRWVAVKSIYDSITWTTLVPTMHFELKLDITVGGLKWGTASFHSGELRSIEARRTIGVNQFEAAKPLLPHQGIQVWWRPDQDDGPPRDPLEGQEPDPADEGPL